MAPLTDISLVAQVTVLGNRRAFDELVRRYQSPVRRFFLHQTLGDEQLSDDLAQDTFIKAYMNISKFRGLASRSKKQTEDIDVVPERTGLQVQTSLKMDMYHALALLKPDERTCITLQLIDGYDIVKIAEITQIKEGTVKSHLSRGKEKLANYLKQNGYG